MVLLLTLGVAQAAGVVPNEILQPGTRPLEIGYLVPPDKMEPLIVPGKLDALEKIRKFILLAAENAGLEKARAYKLSLLWMKLPRTS